MDTSDTKINNIQANNTTIQPLSRIVSVQSIGEVQCPPSLVKFGVIVSSVKESVEAANLSVKRRADYIIQVLRNNGIKEKSYKCSTDIFRKDSECVRVQTDFLIECESVSKCEAARNLLIEKLDASSVQFTSVTYHHLFEDREEKRYVQIDWLASLISTLTSLMYMCMFLCNFKVYNHDCNFKFE